MVILGIDPGSRKTGFGVIHSEKKTLSYIDSGVLNFGHIDHFVDRLGLIYSECELLIERYHPTVISIESLIYVKSVPALAKLAQARGAMIAAFMKTHSGKVVEYAPNAIKAAVSGYGQTDKFGVEKSLGFLFGKKTFKTHDESDALAIAVCHALLGHNNHEKIKFEKTDKKRGLSSALRNHPSVKAALSLGE